MKIRASIVLYNNDKPQLKRAISSVLDSNIDAELVLIDNSPNDSLSSLTSLDDRVDYIFNGKNLGYGAAHNIALRKSMQDKIPYHLVLNPDVYFNDNVLFKLYEYMEKTPTVGNVMPKVHYPSGDLQYLAKLLPDPADLFLRRFIGARHWLQSKRDKYELKFTGYRDLINAPNLSGCFMFLRTEALEDIGVFDKSIFMYLEDVDLNRRIHENYQTMFFPEISIFHEHARASYKNKKLLFHHIKSSIYYFNKWGWFFDKKRKKFNNRCLHTVGYRS